MREKCYKETKNFTTRAEKQLMQKNKYYFLKTNGFPS